MPTLHTDDLLPGMVAARDVKDRSGRLLLREGCELTERSMKVLRSWGIATVEVQEDESTRAKGTDESAKPRRQLDPVLVAKAREEVDTRFVHVEMNHPAAQALYKAIIERAVRRLSAGGQRGH